MNPDLTGEAALAAELKRYRCLCWYPSSGTDLSDLDFFGSGRLPWGERVDRVPTRTMREVPRCRHGWRRETPVSRSATGPSPGPGEALSPTDPGGADDLPDAFVHTDICFYQEFAASDAASALERGFHGSFEVLSVRELPALAPANRIWDNLGHTGRCFEHRLRLWGGSRPTTLIYCLGENEAFAARFLLAHGIRVPVIWSRSWAGGRTAGTWLANVLARLGTRKLYTDWLCVPGQRGEPANHAVRQHYPDLMTPATVRLVRNDERRWIDEGHHGWVEEYDVLPRD